jgi:gas vesicle protein
MAQRLEEIKRKVRELQEAGKQDEAERVKREGEEIMRAMQGRGREGGPPGGPDRERMMQRLEEIKRKVHELQEAGKQDEAERVKREGEEIMRALQGRGREGGPPGGPDRERMVQRIEELKRKIRELQEAGKEDEVEKLKREGQELMRAMQGRGPEGGPREGRPHEGQHHEGPGDVAARVHRLQAAAENLRAAGFGREADHVMQLVEQLTSGRAPREGEPRGEGPRREGMGPGVQELRGEVQQMRREMQELREHLKQLLERNQPHGERK